MPVAVDVHGQGRDRRPIAPVADGGGPPGTRPRAHRVRRADSSSRSATTWSSTRRVAGTPMAPSGSSTSTPSPPRSTRTTSPRSSSWATSTGRSSGCSRRSCRRRRRPERRERHARARPCARRPAGRPPRRPARRRRRRRLPDQAPEGDRGPPPGARAPTTSSVCDVGAHKVWVARLYQAYEPNTVIIRNGFAAMGISCRSDRGQAGPSRSQGRGAHRRRRVPDEQPGAGDRQAVGAG